MTLVRTTTIYAAIAALLVSSFSLLFLHSTPAQALSGSDWKAGRIIDDAVFFNKDTMTVDQITNFINSKVTTCDRNRASSNPSYQPPWTCLKEYQENITTKENNIGKFNPDGTPKSVAGGKTAAQIIWEVAQQYGINPQVLIVMLQKEQSLITDNWPWAVQYQKAMGYACPDTAPCDTQYYGFYNQVSSAAWQMKRYVQLPDNYNFKAGVTRYIQYSPNASCGGSSVFIENAATAALYNYTPYQPNAGALANLYGSADCGAYGNRNFWRMFNEWFGSPNKSYAEITATNYGAQCPVLNKSGFSNPVYCSSPVNGDFNGDGFEDIALASVYSDKKAFNLWLFPGSASGVGSPVLQQSFSTAQYWDYSLIKSAVADLNNDGYSDVVLIVGDGGDRFVVTELRGSNLGLKTAPNFRWDRWYGPATGWYWSSIDVIRSGGDFNGDGFEDIALASVYSDKKAFNLWLFPGSASGVGSPVLQQSFSTAQYWNYSAIKSVTVNYDNDTFDDLVLFAADSNDKFVSIELKGSATGLKTTPKYRWDRWYGSSNGLTWSSVEPIRSGGDFNGDGFEDIALVSVYKDKKAFNLWLFPGSAIGIGNLVYMQSFDTSKYWNESITKMVVTNTNNDNYSDLVMLKGDLNDTAVVVQINGNLQGLKQSPVFKWDRWYKPTDGWYWSRLQ